MDRSPGTAAEWLTISSALQRQRIKPTQLRLLLIKLLLAHSGGVTIPRLLQLTRSAGSNHVPRSSIFASLQLFEQRSAVVSTPPRLAVYRIARLLASRIRGEEETIDDDRAYASFLKGLAEEIRKLMLAQKITEAELAMVVPCEASLIGDVLSGAEVLTLRQYDLIVRALRAEPAHVYRCAEDKRAEFIARLEGTLL